MKYRIALLALAACILSFPAQAQYVAVASCPGAVAIQPVNSSGAVAIVDVNGNLCISGSSGGGGAVTIADGANVTQGSIADAASSAGGVGTLSAKLRLMTTQLATINTTLGSPFQAGGSIGNTTFASTQSGTWNINNISGTISLPTGAATSAAQATMATNQTAVQTPVAPATATATKGELIGCQYNTPAVTFTNGQQGSIACGPSGEFLISGTIASGTTDSGNPVKIGGVFNTTLPTLTTGQRGDLQFSARSLLINQNALVLGTGSDGFSNAAIGFYTSSVGGGTQGLTAGLGYLYNGTSWDRFRSDSGTGAATGAALNVPAPTASATNAIAPVVAGSASSSAVLKASAGNLYSAYATCTAACWLMAFNATSAPADGATTAGIASGNLQDCIPIAAGGIGSLGANGSPPEPFTVGITLVVSSTSCATKTASTVGFIHGSAK